MTDSNFIQYYKNLETTLETESGDAKITVSGVASNEGFTLDYNLLTAPKQFKIDPTGAHYSDGVNTYDTTLEDIALVQQTFQAVELPPNSTTLKINNKVLATNNITNQILIDANLNTVSITDGTTTNTIDKNGYTTRNTTANLTHYLNFSDNSSTGTGAIQKTTGLSCNPSTNTLTATTVNVNNLSSTSYKMNINDRMYQEINPATSWNDVNGFYGLAKDAYPLPNPYSSGVKAVSTWTYRTTPNLNWSSVCWSPELKLFCAVSGFDSTIKTNRAMTSPDGITWTPRTTPISSSDNDWYGLCWSPQLRLFVATGFPRTMSSSNGINWVVGGQTNPNIYGLCWSPELSLFVGVVAGGTNTEQIYTSPNGTTWTTRPTPSITPLFLWFSVCWSPELSLFVAVGQALSAGITQGVMTSSNGISGWALKTTQSSNWNSVCWSPELGLFVAVASSGTYRVMTSPDGNTWTERTLSPTLSSNNWKSVCWSPELGLFVAVALSGTGNGVMSSPDGINWTERTSVDSGWNSVCWSPELGIFVSCAQTTSLNGIMTSSLKGRPPTSYNVFDSAFNSIDQNGNWTINGSVTNTPNVTISNNDTNSNFYPVFASSTGSQGLNIDSTTGPLTYNPNTSVLSSSIMTTTTQVNTPIINSSGAITMNFGTTNTLNLTGGGYLTNGTAITTAGGGTLPALTAGFLRIVINGTKYRIPIYATNQ